ncbi:efflux RND transporter periplasmic adaptor subunit [Luteolibacter pohnpeiensis]|uniref:Efflux RND transporter periplasmic adaptor subunit n=1 Tax=Luteolibacter pohnpeiensis TaxID=454153 RepID=A0A934VQC1_9BACT|nr:efflux RND transporter periplasmic adaptor subunit [Luteolibacter pohnpeiensis]MBK1881946.1 efflux RND transporter periplasmic adaptor subunit [Luteolibacter pohnpeiensis]
MKAKTLLLFALLTPLAVAEPAAPTPVRVTHPAPADSLTAIRAIGRTAPAEQARLFSRATGIISERPVDIGDRVKAGQVLAVIDAPEIAHQIAAAEAQVQQTKARAELADALLKRSESLAKNSAVSQETIDERLATTKTAEADKLAAEAALATLQEQQRFLTIRAPFDGIITARQIDRGDHVNGDPSSLDAWLFQIARIDELRMILSVPPPGALHVKKGQTAEVEFADIPGKIFNATVARTNSLIDSASGTMQVELALPNPDLALPAGLSGDARIKNDSASAVLMVPSNAIATRDGVSQVAVAKSGKVSFVSVALGRTLGNQVEIFSGLTPSDDVIVSPNSLLQSGDAVAANPLATPAKVTGG